MKKLLIVAAVVVVVVLMGMQSPQKALAQGKVYEAANGEIFPVTDPAAIASLEAKTQTKECALMVIGPKAPTAAMAKAAALKTIRLYVCGTSKEPYCITQQGRRVCYP